MLTPGNKLKINVKGTLISNKKIVKLLGVIVDIFQDLRFTWFVVSFSYFGLKTIYSILKCCIMPKKIVNNNNYNNNNGNNLEMTWIDYRKAYDMVSHSWISEILELVQVSDSILEFVKDQWQIGKQS